MDENIFDFDSLLDESLEDSSEENLSALVESEEDDLFGDYSSELSDVKDLGTFTVDLGKQEIVDIYDTTELEKTVFLYYRLWRREADIVPTLSTPRAPSFSVATRDDRQDVRKAIARNIYNLVMAGYINAIRQNKKVTAGTELTIKDILDECTLMFNCFYSQINKRKDEKIKEMQSNAIFASLNRAEQENCCFIISTLGEKFPGIYEDVKKYLQTYIKDSLERNKTYKKVSEEVQEGINNLNELISITHEEGLDKNFHVMKSDRFTYRDRDMVKRKYCTARRIQPKTDGSIEIECECGEVFDTPGMLKVHLLKPGGGYIYYVEARQHKCSKCGKNILLPHRFLSQAAEVMFETARSNHSSQKAVTTEVLSQAVLGKLSSFGFDYGCDVTSIPKGQKLTSQQFSMFKQAFTNYFNSIERTNRKETYDDIKYLLSLLSSNGMPITQRDVSIYVYSKLIELPRIESYLNSIYCNNYNSRLDYLESKLKQSLVKFKDLSDNELIQLDNISKGEIAEPNYYDIDGDADTKEEIVNILTEPVDILDFKRRVEKMKAGTEDELSDTLDGKIALTGVGRYIEREYLKGSGIFRIFVLNLFFSLVMYLRSSKATRIKLPKLYEINKKFYQYIADSQSELHRLDGTEFSIEVMYGMFDLTLNDVRTEAINKYTEEFKPYYTNYRYVPEFYLEGQLGELCQLFQRSTSAKTIIDKYLETDEDDLVDNYVVHIESDYDTTKFRVNYNLILLAAFVDAFPEELWKDKKDFQYAQSACRELLLELE